MNSVADVWDNVLSQLKGELSETTIATWFDELEAVDIQGNTFILHCSNDFKKGYIESLFMKNIKASLHDIFSTDFEVKILDDLDYAELKDNRPHRQSERFTSAEFTFETFVVGPSNKLAYAASVSVAEHPAQNYNPLLIYGDSGLGKTHLIYAIANVIRRNDPRSKIAYVKGDDLTNELVDAIREGKTAEMREKYRQADLLLVDDVQFIAGKEQTQEEFFWTFNTLHDAKKQIIISADRPPKDIEGIADRLVSRFEWGLVTDIQPPDLETRVAILQKKAEMKKYMNIPEDVIMFIAQNIPSNIRELEGSLNRIVACSDLNHEPINIENASVWLKDLIKEHPVGTVSIGLIQQMTAEAFGFSVEELLSKKRTADLALARQAAMYVARNKTNEALIQIAYAFNKKDHTVVIHACRKIAELIKTDLRIRSFVDNIVNKL